MGTRHKRVDAYIAGSAPFARPILNHLRKLVHRACPETVEAIKWGMPHFDHLGMMCSMAAFKEHCAFGFWKARLLDDPARALDPSEAMGHLGRITAKSDLPPDTVLARLIRQAARLNEEGATVPRTPRATPRPAPLTPAWFMAALQKKPKALATFRKFPPSHRREYIEWVTGAKREETRKKRLATTLDWLTRGRTMNWKYESEGRRKNP